MTETDVVGLQKDSGAAGDALVVFTPSGKRGRFPIGTPLLVAARRLGVDLDTVCGGRGVCGRCQVAPSFGEFPKHGLTSSPDALSPVNKVETRYASKREIKDGRRLGCQTLLQGDTVVDVPPDSQVHAQIVRKSAEQKDILLDPATRFFEVAVREPDMHTPKGDLERLFEALAEQHDVTATAADLSVIKTLQPTLRAGRWTVVCAVFQDAKNGEAQVTRLWPGTTAPPAYGAAFDIGSTTIAGHLVDLRSGAVAASSGVMNPQIRFGEDLMSRVSYAMMNPAGVADMTAAVREAIDQLIAQMAKEAGADALDVLEGVFVGNPVMHHLLLGVDPVELGGAPFALATSSGLSLPARDVGLAFNPDARLYLPPCIAGHVGADAAAVVLSEKPHEQSEMTLIVDVGTNAEIVLGDTRRVVACSSPTGPAFEGAQISAGQRAAAGAIERIRIDPLSKSARYRVIGCDLWSDEPGFADATSETGVTGICGSGIIEAVAELRLADVIDVDGVIRGDLAAAHPEVTPDGRTFAYEIAPAAGDRNAIRVTQGDVRAIQLAKAALYAGCKLLMEKLNVTTVDRVLLAGAFGAHISPLHAMVLGMIPDCEVDRVASVGNAAGTGARIALLNRQARRDLEDTVRRIDKIETAIEPRFQEHFVDAMAVPNKRDPFPKLSEIATLPASNAAGPAARRGSRRRSQSAAP